MKKLVSNQISPNFTFADSLYAMKQIFVANSQKKSAYYNILFTRYFDTENFFLTNAVRTGLAKIIEVVNPSKKKKIGIPAFICAVVATPFLKEGYEIEWLDTDNNGVISLEEFKKKADQLSVIVVPHVFGQKAPLKEIYEIAKKKNILVIEDCAHLFKVRTQSSQSSNLDNNSKFYCDIRIASFGREKVFSCVSGGAVIWNKNSQFFTNKTFELEKASKGWTIRHALQPLIFALAIPWWHWGGKLIPYLASKTKLLPRAVTNSEKKGKEDFPLYALPIIQQKILLQKFQKADQIISHRKKIATAWEKILTKLFPESEIIVPDNAFRVILKTERKQILAKAKKLGFNLHEWDGIPISPLGTDLAKFGYSLGQCPKAEHFAQNYVTFPTNIRTSLKDIEIFEKLWSK